VPSGLVRAILAGAFLTGAVVAEGGVAAGMVVEDSLVGVLVAVVVVFEAAADVDLFVDTGSGFLVPIGVRAGLVASVAVVTGFFTGITADSFDSFPVD